MRACSTAAASPNPWAATGPEAASMPNPTAATANINRCKSIPADHQHVVVGDGAEGLVHRLKWLIGTRSSELTRAGPECAPCSTPHRLALNLYPAVTIPGRCCPIRHRTAVRRALILSSSRRRVRPRVFCSTREQPRMRPFEIPGQPPRPHRPSKRNRVHDRSVSPF
jgi:hypothetical protein